MSDSLQSSVRGTLQARILEWVAIPSPDLPNRGTKRRSPTLQVFFFFLIFKLLLVTPESE